ncbi:MAG: hypothetical protein AAF561_12205 [Planctomycetota bacterium]
MPPPPDIDATSIDAGSATSRDGYGVRFTISLRPQRRRSEIDDAAFAGAFVGMHSAEEAIEALRPDAERALASVTQSLEPVDVETWQAEPPVEAFAKAVRAFLFRFGMETGPIRVKASSPAFEEQSAMAEAAEAAKRAEGHAASLVAAFHELRQKHPDVPPGKLLMGLPEADRRQALKKLLEAEAEQDASRLFVAAGSALYELHGDQLAVFAAAGGSLGPIRRLAFAEVSGRPIVACGCRDGVTLQPVDVPDAAGEVPTGLPSGDDDGRGFGGVDVSDGGDGVHLWAGHASRGLEGFLLRGLQSPMPPLWRVHRMADQFPGPIRAVVGTTEDRVVVLSNDGVTLVGTEDEHDLMPLNKDVDSPAVAVLRRPTMPSRPLVIRQDGSVGQASLDDGAPVGAALSFVETVRSSAGNAHLTAGCAAAWLGDIRIAACLKDGPIAVAGVEDDVVVEYQSPYVGFAEVAASAGRVAAINVDRERLVVWRLDRPEQPEHDVFLPSTTRSRGADLIFVPTSSS